VNGPPAIAAPATATVGVDQATAVMGVLLPESGNTNGESFTVTVSDTAGLLTASGSEAAISWTGTTNLTISGALAQVNAALATLTETAPARATAIAAPRQPSASR
jgi:hypothetical protein